MDEGKYQSDNSHRRFIRVAVVDENDIFRRGILACLEGDNTIQVVFEAPTGPVPALVDVAIASDRAAADIVYEGPTLICSDTGRAGGRGWPYGNIVAVIPRSRLTEDQLGAAVRAAASGLRVDVGDDEMAAPSVGMPERYLEILRLLATGHGTREISDSVGCSERTVKYAIREAERQLEARSRAHVVAEAIRQGII